MPLLLEEQSPWDTISTTSFHAEITTLSYEFSHELSQVSPAANSSRIQQALFSLIPPDEVIHIHYKICQALAVVYAQDDPEESRDSEQDDVNVFVASIFDLRKLANCTVNL
jgi:hypothetical protein